ncbi:MAG: NUDIX domain-containing protein [Anaerolineae bacterium]|nr:NUDIX domain-containing protein [Anaerolineae bacterium]
MRKYDSLLHSLQMIPRPDGVEEWLDDLKPNSSVSSSAEYQHAIHDLLTLLGALNDTGEETSSPMGYYLLRSLIALLQDTQRSGQSLTPAWQGTASSAAGGLGARLVNLLETYRLNHVADPTPLRTISGVLAVIKRRTTDQDVYLLQYDHKAEQFQPIGGKCEAFDADNYAALIRELCEELNLEHLELGKDLTITPIFEHESQRRVSATLQLITQYDHSFYHLTNIHFPLNTDDDTRWLTLDEVITGRSIDGKKVSGLLGSLTAERLNSLPYSVL